MRIGIENASYYVAPPGGEMTEAEFISHIVHEADCLLHLDVNNIYVNSRNFDFDPLAFMDALPLERTCYVHVAGHFVEPDGLLIDTHGADVIDPRLVAAGIGLSANRQGANLSQAVSIFRTWQR